MAWATQTIESGGFIVRLEQNKVVLNGDMGYQTIFEPEATEEAHTWAMMLRKAARRLEEIGKGLE